jgi:ABC-2 type transport system ATP-binding protein
VAEGTPEELKRRVPSGHITLRFTDVDQLGRAAAALDESRRTDDALTLDVPSDGGVKALRALLDQLEGAAVEVDELAIHRPDLDDVFLALTGRPTQREEDVA